MEWKWEVKKRGRRRRNIITKEMEDKEKDIDKIKIIKKIVKEKRKCRKWEGRRMEKNNWRRIKLRRIEKKRELIKNRKEILEKRIRIDNDLIWRKRKMR